MSTAKTRTLIQRRFTQKGQDPFDTVTWVKRDAVIKRPDGSTSFEQLGVEFPDYFTQTSVDVVTLQYFWGQLGTPQRETSLRDVIDRVASSMRDWAVKDNLLTKAESSVFYDELVYLLLHQMAAFNSPVWYNVGTPEHKTRKPQASACFIQSVDDSMESIMELAKNEGLLYKWGSGTGTNYSTLRGSNEPLSSGGTSSGPVAFMRLFDAVAGSIKSGGKTRRAAKMVILDSDHPDIEEFINSKVLGEDVAQALIAAGFDGDFSAKGGAYEYAPFQNANHSVRLNAAFMQAVEQDDDWHLVNRTDGKVAKTLKARSLMDQIANAAWRSADPGVQFDDVVNHWNPVLDVQRINASNPCSEYMFVDDSACNLASINFMRLRDKDGNVDAELLRHVTTLLITAMEAVVSNASYPNQLIEKNSHDFRPLGLGYGNMGALLMSLGLGYDTAAARRYAGYLSSLICSQAYLTSAQLAERVGPFARFPETPGSFTRVMRQHLQAAEAIPADFDDRPDIANWQKVVEACASGRGVRNAQVTVIAPTGTISFLMGFDTTGIEPPFALQTFKKFIDGSIKQLTIDCARQALEQIQPQPSVGVVETNETLRQWREGLWEWINEHGTPEGYLRFRAQDLSIFDCAVNSGEGTRYLSPLAHVQMMAAVQPFISGAISKTVNLPTEISVDEVYDMHLVAWKQGLKSLAMYRNGSKGSAPLRTTVDEDQKQLSKPAAVTSTNGLAPPVGEPVRHRLPETAAATRHKFSISGYEGYIHVGEFASKHPGEVFVTMSKAGSTINGLMDSLATMISLLLQYGVPLEKISEKMRHQSFTPQGITGNPDIHFATSPVDYLAQYLTLHYDGEKQIHGSKPLQDSLDGVTFDNVPTVAQAAAAVRVQEMGTKQTEMQFPIALLAKVGSGAETGEICGECGNTMRFVGTCYICPHCGNNSGCS